MGHHETAHFLHTKSRGVGLLSMSAKEKANSEFDLDVRWIQSGQWVIFQSGEGEKFGRHMYNCSRSLLSPPGSTGVGKLEFQRS